MEKKHWIIVGVILAIIIIWYFFLRKKAESSWTSAGYKFYRVKDSMARPSVRVKNPNIQNSVYGSCMAMCTGSYSQSFCEGYCGPFKGMGEGGMEDENIKKKLSVIFKNRNNTGYAFAKTTPPKKPFVVLPGPAQGGHYETA